MLACQQDAFATSVCFSNLIDVPTAANTNPTHPSLAYSGNVQQNRNFKTHLSGCERQTEGVLAIQSMNSNGFSLAMAS